MHLTMLLDMAADGFGDRALLGPAKPGITGEGLRRRALRGAEMVRAQKADALVYLAVNGAAFPVALFAAACAGVPLVPLNYRLGVEQLEGMLRRHPGALVLTEECGHPAVEAVAMPSMSTAEWLGATALGSPQQEAAPDDDVPAVVIYTSGTTAEPKGVLLRHANLVSYVLGSVEYGSAGETDAALVSVPPYHIAAVANAITNLYAGRRVVTLEQFDARQWIETVRSEGITNALVVPTMLARILDAPGDLSVPTLRALAYGGAPMPARVVRRALETWPQLDLVNAYGLTETSSTITVLTPEDHRVAVTSDDPFVQARLGSVGRALPGVEVEVRDDQGQPVEPGVRGRIHVRGDQVSAEYAGIGRLVDDGGWFDTRDDGFLDEDGYLFIGGRSDDTIIRGGENIAPAEIENVLLRYPAVADAVVVGLPDEEWGQRLVAAVVPREGESIDVQDLRSFALGILRSSKTPQEIVTWPELPRTETGKLLRREVVRGLDVGAAAPA